MIALFFSFKGRIGRLQFFASTFMIGLILVASFLALLSSSLFEIARILNQDLFLSDFSALSFNVILFIFIWVVVSWMQASLVWRRTRDISESMLPAYLFVVLQVLAWIPIVGTIFGLFNLALYLMLCLMPAKDQHRHQLDQVDPLVFGALGDAADGGDMPEAGFASNMSDADLVARANQLRAEQEQKKAVAQQVQPQNTAGNAPKSFGRRSGLQPS